MESPHAEPPLNGIHLVFTDAVRTGLKDWIESGRDFSKLPTPQAYITKALLETLQDPAVRREVFVAAGDGIVSIYDVHTVMDGLVSVLYPSTTEDPTTTEEQEVDSSKKDGSG